MATDASVHAGLHSRSTTARRLTTLLRVVLALSVVALAYAHFFPHDFRRSTPAYLAAAWVAFMIRTFSFHLGLALGVVALAAAWLRHFRLLAPAALLAGFCVDANIVTYFRRSAPLSEATAFTVMSQNLLRDNDRTEATLTQIWQTEPDILLLQEYTPRWRAALEDELREEYPYRHHVERDDCFGLALYSRWPVENVDDALPLGRFGLPQMRAVVRVHGQQIAIYNVHLWPPKGLDTTREQREAFADLLDMVARERLPIVLAGDFNFTAASAMADELRRRHLSDVHDLAGRWRGTTWPVHHWFWLLPGLRLDHIYVSTHFVPVRAWTGARIGSDHRAVIARIAPFGSSPQ